jgi:hypothetical protein
VQTILEREDLWDLIESLEGIPGSTGKVATSLISDGETLKKQNRKVLSIL